MIVVFGTKGHRENLAQLTLVCRRCGSPSAQRLERVSTRFTVFFIPLFTVSTRYRLHCALCGGVTDLDETEARRLASP